MQNIEHASQLKIKEKYLLFLEKNPHHFHFLKDLVLGIAPIVEMHFFLLREAVLGDWGDLLLW